MRKRKNDKRQPGSLQVWYNETNHKVWESVIVHHGRTTRKVNGPEDATLAVAHQFFSRALKDGV